MEEIIRNILVEVSLIGLVAIVNLAPYWQGMVSMDMFMNATRKQAENDPQMPLEPKMRQRYLSIKLFKATSLFYILGAIFLSRDLWRLFHMMAHQIGS